MRYTVRFEEIELKDIAEVGGKNASLGELTRGLAAEGIAVPQGFALTTQAFRDHLMKAGLPDRIYPALEKLDPSNVAELRELGATIRRQILEAPLPEDVTSDLLRAYSELSCSYAEGATDVAVHSSATAED